MLLLECSQPTASTRKRREKQSPVELASSNVLTEKVNEVNNIIREHSRENNWALIEHDKITPKHLNRSGLHLNKSGTALFAKNFISHIRSN